VRLHDLEKHVLHPLVVFDVCRYIPFAMYLFPSVPY
jgi:hypothetical protein